MANLERPDRLKTIHIFHLHQLSIHLHLYSVLIGGERTSEGERGKYKMNQNRQLTTQKEELL